MSDYHLWFWHASFGYAGSLNDLNILNLSPLLELLVDGTFTELEQSSMFVPFDVAGNLFNCLFVLVDGIYPPYLRFVKGIQLPLTDAKKRYIAWQEASRKGIKRAFGNIQSRYQVMTRPFFGHSLNKICNIVSACLIMHNMFVSDRVMVGDVYARYNLGKSLTIDEDERIENVNGDEIDAAAGEGRRQQIGLANAGNANVVQNVLEQQNHWRLVNDRQGHTRLHCALLALKG
jgi:hypothetical protein